MLPPLERVFSEMGLTEQEIMERGTLQQRIWLYFVLYDYSQYSNIQSTAAFQELRQIITTDEEIALFERCRREYIALYNIGEKVAYYYKRYQTSLAALARVLLLWDLYKTSAKAYNKALEMTLDTERQRAISLYKKGEYMCDSEPEEPEDNTEPPTEEQQINWLTEMAGNGFINGIEAISNSIMVDTGARIRHDYSKGGFYVDIHINQNGERSLYEKIQEEARQTEEDFTDFVAIARAIRNFEKSKQNTLHYLPVNIRAAIDNAESEAYIRYLIKNKEYLRSELNYRRWFGEDITPEQEAVAVVPDYYEIQPSQSSISYWAEEIDRLLNQVK